MNLLFEIADKDLIFIVLAFIGVIIFGVVIFYIVRKNNKVRPISEEERFDREEEIEVKELTEEQKQAKAELERVFNMMSADLEAKEAPSAIDEFEREQEENAIISYQELIKQAKEKGQISEDFEVEEPKYESYEPYESRESYERPKAYGNEEKKFKNSEIISPIFGVQGSSSYPANKKENKESSSDENTRFLNSLKEFRENL